MTKKAFRFINLIFLFVGLGIIYFIGAQIGWEQIWGKILSIDLLEMLIILFLPILWNFLHSLGWFFLLDQKKNFRFLQLLGAHISATAISEVVPLGQAGGEPYRIYFVKKQYHSDNSPNIIASIILYNTIHTIVTGLLFVAGFIAILSTINVVFYKRLLFILVLLGGFLGIIFFIQKQKKGFMGNLFDLLERFKIFRSFVQKKKSKALLVDERLRQFYHHHRIYFYISLFIILLAKTMGAVEIYLIMKFIGYEVEFLHAFIVFSGSAFIQIILFFFPAQIGASEGSIVYLFSVLGNPPIFALTLALFRRIRVIFWTILGLIIGYLWGPKLGGKSNVSLE